MHMNQHTLMLSRQLAKYDLIQEATDGCPFSVIHLCITVRQNHLTLLLMSWLSKQDLLLDATNACSP